MGGGHFLDVRHPEVLNFLFSFMPAEEWKLYSRDSRIIVNNNMINSPIEANIWQMKLEDQVEYLKSIAIAGCNLGTAMPEKFVDWIYWKLGRRVAEDYMIPYNQKLFGKNLDSLGTYWLNKLPNVSFDETLMSCLEKKAYGTQPGHASFYYPKQYGYGEIWIRMAKALGNHIVYNTPVTSIDIEKRTVNQEYQADYIINTIPWKEFDTMIGLPDKLFGYIQKLNYSSVVIEYIPENIDTEAQWIYYPDLELSYHRILVRHNFCPGSKGYWTETNAARFDKNQKNLDNYYENKYAYPVNTVGKEEMIVELLAYLKEKNVVGLGRWGEWRHYNSDVVVSLAMQAADRYMQ